MATVGVTNPFGALTVTTQILAASGTQTQLATGVYLIGFLAGESNRGRQYNPWSWGFAPQTGDAASKWLPSVTAITPYGSGAGAYGEYFIQLAPGTGDTVNVASVQSVRVDWNTLFIVASGSF